MWQVPETALTAAGVFLAGIVLAEAFCRAGSACVDLVRLPGRKAAGSWGSGFLAGWFVAGTLVLGLAAAGLLFKPVMVSALLLLAVAGSGGSWRGVRVRGLAQILAGTGPIEKALLACMLIPLVLRLPVPENGGDSFVYHLGAVDQWLKAHRVLLDHVPISHHLPLPFDAAFGYPLALGDDRIAKFLVVLSVFAGVSGFFGARRGPGLRPGAWTALMLSLSGATLWNLATVTKNDVVASATCMVGISLLLNRGFLAGALFCGMGVAGKPVFAPLVLMALAASRCPFRALLPAGIALVAPVLPWSVKSFLAVRNPFVPFTPLLWDPFGWDERNRAGFRLAEHSLWVVETWTLPLFLRTLWSYLVQENVLLCALIPAALVWGSARGPVSLCVLGQAVTLFLGHQFRYLLPSTWLSCLVLGTEPRLLKNPKVVRLLGAMALGVAAWRLASPPGLLASQVRSALSPASASSAPFRDLALELRRIGPRRLLTCGEVVTYRLEGRVIFGGGLGETPVVWKLVNEARTPREIRKRVRQLGSPWLLYNYVAAKLTHGFTKGFAWDDRMIRLHMDFSRGYLTPLWASASCDSASGGYILFGIAPVPGRPGRSLRYLPGTETVTFEERPAREPAEIAGLRRKLENLLARYPDVLSFRAQAAQTFSLMGDQARTYGLLKPVIEAGVIDSISLPTYGIAALQGGRNDEAIEVLRRCLGRYESSDRIVRFNLAQALGSRALGLAARGDAAGMERAIDEGLEVMKGSPWGSGDKVMRRRCAERVALLKGMKGDVRKAQGDGEAALRWYADALRTAPGVAGADAWRREIREASSPGREGP